MQRSFCTNWPSWPCLHCPHLPSLVHSHMKSLRWAVPYLQGDTHCPIAEQENGLWLGCFQTEMDVPFLSLWETVPPKALTAEPCGSTCESNQKCHLHVKCSPQSPRTDCLIVNPWVASRVIAHFIDEEMRQGGYSSRVIQLDRLSPCTPSFGPRDPCLESQPGSGNMSSNH